MRDPAAIEALLEEIWTKRPPHLHGLAFYVSASRSPEEATVHWRFENPDDADDPEAEPRPYIDRRDGRVEGPFESEEKARRRADALCLLRPSVPYEHYRIDVETDTRDGHFEHTGGVDEEGRRKSRHVRCGLHRKAGRIDVDHLHPTLWALHTKHLYYGAEASADDVRALVEAGAGLLHDMAHQRPVHEHHARIDRDDIARASSDWRLLWRRRVPDEPRETEP